MFTKLVILLLANATFLVSTKGYLGKIEKFISRDIPEVVTAFKDYQSCTTEELVSEEKLEKLNISSDKESK